MCIWMMCWTFSVLQYPLVSQPLNHPCSSVCEVFIEWNNEEVFIIRKKPELIIKGKGIQFNTSILEVESEVEIRPCESPFITTVY
jgi:hypothetical protein